MTIFLKYYLIYLYCIISNCWLSGLFLIITKCIYVIQSCVAAVYITVKYIYLSLKAKTMAHAIFFLPSPGKSRVKI